MIPTLIRRLATGIKPKPDVLVTPYKAKKIWPPDFTKLSPQEQLRFEKRYKRRVRLMGMRSRWIKFTKIAQVICITSVSFYFVFLMDWEGPHEPFGPIRRYVRRAWQNIQSPDPQVVYSDDPDAKSAKK